MQTNYKVIISGRNIYKEIELNHEDVEVSVGTETDCVVRLHKDLFFEKINLVFLQTNGIWSVVCSDNLYLDAGDVRKLLTKKLTHGEIFTVKYQYSGNEVFFVEFLIDFDNERRKYERAIDVSSLSAVRIGSDSTNHIVINSAYIKQDSIELQRTSDGYRLKVFNSTYGVYHNGAKAKNQCVISNGDFFSISDFIFYVKDEVIWTEIRDGMLLNGLNFGDYPECNGYPKFNRNTRIKTVVSDEVIEILDPPACPTKPKNNLFMRLLPSMGMLIAAVVMAFFGGMMIVMSAISGVMAVITTILGIKEGNKDYKEASQERIDKYNAYIEKKKEEVEKCRQQELYELESLYSSQAIIEERFNAFSSDLFDRTKNDDDFLCVRLGEGDVESKRIINYKKQEKLEIEDELQLIPEQICESYKYLHNAPIICDLKESDALGIVGAPEYRFDFLKNMVIDISARQFFSDVKMFFIAQQENREAIQWLRLLPHTFNEEIGIRNVVCDDDCKNVVFEYLYKELTNREQNKSYDTNLIVFFYDEYGFGNHPISKFVSKAKDLGVTFVFFGDAIGEIPQGCNSIVVINDDKSAMLIDSKDKSKTVKFNYPRMSDVQAQSIIKLLAPVYTEEISLEGSLTKNISLFELLNILAVDEIDLNERWSESQVFKSMSAPLGVSKTGVVYLDLHDKAHGPHGLVAGTTGSGKSEILQTYILAMSTLFHPYEVAFVIIDFKGGGMVNQFKELPHLLGAITNIDGKEINRSLKSIKAELQKRQRLFSENDVNHIDKYIKKYKSGEASVPLPHLIIIVDEFAELKAEQPEFMKELISAARIGRSLGVHLILATQKPSGQVNEQIWSNSRFKLCLKVQGPEDSNEVLKSPLAAEIKEPGRAYLQVGNNEIFELFQSAYSGASEKTDNSNIKEFTVYNVLDSGRKVPVFVQKKKKTGEGNATQLDAIVKHVASYCDSVSLPKLPDICLPSLSKCIEFSCSDRKGVEDDYNTAIGIYDDPDRQYQGEYSVNLIDQNVMIVGSSQSGKTNVLQTIIRSLATRFSPDEVNIYIMDFASMVLKNFETLRHVGGVVTASEDEKLKNLIKLLLAEIEERKEKLLAAGVSSFKAYKEAGHTDLPHIVLMLDNLTIARELYFSDNDVLLNISREGLSVGISVVIANSTTNGIGYRYLSNFNCKIALFCNDTSEYYSLFDHCKETIDDIHGRALIEIDKTHYECQMYLSFEGEKEFERVANIKTFISEINDRYKNQKAKIIPVIPEVLSADYVDSNFNNYIKNDGEVVIGLDYATVSPFVINFLKLGIFGLSGQSLIATNSLLKYALDSLDRNHSNKSEVYIFDSINRELSDLRDREYVERYGVLGEDAIEAIEIIEHKLEQRYMAIASGQEDALASEKTIVLVLNSPDIVTAVCANSKGLASFNNIVGKYKNMKVCVVLGNIENKAISYNSPEIYRIIRDNKQLFFFGDMVSLKVFDVPIAYQREYKKPLANAECYFFNEDTVVKLKTAQNISA